ncbi:MAG: helix-turn-helix transcriptional regulator [Magnetococcales bacterium]|nr:helix-turn-helix transcriptional regulator [Magnetococcales bacterium]
MSFQFVALAVSIALAASDGVADASGNNTGITRAIQTNLRSAFDGGATHSPRDGQLRSFAQDLRTWRQTQGLTAEEAGRLLGVESSVVTAYESDLFQPSDEILRLFRQAREDAVQR